MWRILWLAAVSAKNSQGTISIGGRKDDNRWKYMSKFGYTIGQGSYQIRLRTIRPYVDEEKKVALTIFLDEEWDDAERIENACERKTKSRVKTSISLKPDGEWSEWNNNSLTQSIRPHVWYFVVEDCDDQLPQLTRLRFEVQANQENGSEFSVELRGMLVITLIKLLLFSLFLVHYVKLCRKFIASAESLHPVIWTLSFGIGFQYLSVACTWFHLWAYSSNGYGLRALDIIGEILAALSNVLMSSLLILLALGYTLLQSQLGQLDIAIPIVFLICIVHVLLVGFGKIKDDASYKFHEMEGVIGWIVCAVRIALYIWFLWAINSSSKECKTNVKLLFFLRKFKLASTLYFLSFPAIFLITGIWAPYYRHAVFSIGMFMLQAVSVLWLTTLFLSRGDYFDVSTMNASFLPGAGRSSSSKKD